VLLVLFAFFCLLFCFKFQSMDEIQQLQNEKPPVVKIEGQQDKETMMEQIHKLKQDIHHKDKENALLLQQVKKYEQDRSRKEEKDRIIAPKGPGPQEEAEDDLPTRKKIETSLLV